MLIGCWFACFGLNARVGRIQQLSSSLFFWHSGLTVHAFLGTDASTPHPYCARVHRICALDQSCPDPDVWAPNVWKHPNLKEWGSGGASSTGSKKMYKKNKQTSPNINQTTGGVMRRTIKFKSLTERLVYRSCAIYLQAVVPFRTMLQYVVYFYFFSRSRSRAS